MFENLKKFFEYHISFVHKCENCGIRIKNPGTRNVAHIVPKSKFKSVSTHPDNAMHLCTRVDRVDGEKGCHEKYDYTWESASSMEIWPTAKNRFLKFKDLIKETSMILLNFE